MARPMAKVTPEAMRPKASWRPPAYQTLRPVSRVMPPPTMKSATELTARLVMMAVPPSRKANGATGPMAPSAKRMNELACGDPGGAAEFVGLDAEFLAGHRFEGGRFVGHEAGGDLLGFLGGEALGAIDEGEFFGLFFRHHANLFALNLDLLFVEFAGALDGDPFAEGHRDRSSEQASDAGDEDGAAFEFGSGDGHDEAEIRDEAIVGTEYGCAEGVAADVTVATFEASDQGAFDAASGAGENSEDSCVGAFVAGEFGIGGFGFEVVDALVGLFLLGDGRQDSGRAEAAGDPGERFGAPLWGVARN